MERGRKEIKAVLHLPNSDESLRQYEKKMRDFYIAQVEKRLRLLPKEKKLEILDIMISDFSKPSKPILKQVV